MGAQSLCGLGVIVHEQTNARYLTSEIVPEPIDIVVCDASFISLTKVLPAALGLADAQLTSCALLARGWPDRHCG